MSAREEVTVTLLAKNAAQDLQALAPFLRQFAIVVVGDDGSSDDSRRVCEENGFQLVDVSESPSFREKRERIIDEVQSEWVLILDTDERPRGSFVHGLERLIAAAPKVAGYETSFRTYFGSEWIRHGGVYPMWVTRLFRHSEYRGFIGDVHERVALAGRIEKSDLEFDHFSYRDTAHYISKINNYTDQEARELLAKAQVRLLPPLGEFVKSAVVAARVVIAKDMSTARNVTKDRLKNRYVVLVWLPFYPLARFVKLYVIRRGYKDGGVGLRYAALSACYSVVKYSKFFEGRAARDA